MWSGRSDAPSMARSFAPAGRPNAYPNVTRRVVPDGVAPVPSGVSSAALVAETFGAAPQASAEGAGLRSAHGQLSSEVTSPLRRALRRALAPAIAVDPAGSPGVIRPWRWITVSPCSGQRAIASSAWRLISASAMSG